MTLTTGLLAAADAAFATVGESWWQLVLAPAFAVLVTQVGFLAVRGFCHEHSVAYCETTIVRSWRQVLSHLDDVGAGLSRAPALPLRERI